MAIAEQTRGEAAVLWKLYCRQASLDCSDRIKAVTLYQPMNPETFLEKRRQREEPFDATMALPEKQTEQLPTRYYWGLTVNEIAELEGVHTSSI